MSEKRSLTGASKIMPVQIETITKIEKENLCNKQARKDVSAGLALTERRHFVLRLLLSS